MHNVDGCASDFFSVIDGRLFPDTEFCWAHLPNPGYVGISPPN